MKYCYLVLLFAIQLSFINPTFSQCPSCVIDLPTLPEDTIFISDVADGQVGTYFEADMSFRLPKTTTYADPTIDPPLPISSITITSVTNLPPGLQWEANQLEFDTSVETDGCVKFCGTPLVADSFYVNVVVNAQVSIFNQETSFTLPFYIAPASTATEGFSMTNNVACGNTTVEFTNNIAGNENEGVSYFWDFGNGQTSTEENPEPVSYAEGNYTVSYEAVIDTLGYFLNEVTVAEASCTDLFGTPDIYIEVINPSGTVLYTSETIDNTDPPLTFAVPSIPIGEGNYQIQVTDVDAFAEVNCGNVSFNFGTNSDLVDGDLTVEVGLINPMTMVSSEEQVTVYSIPDMPTISPNQVVDLCDGESILLEVADYPNIEWYLDTTIILGENSNVLEVTESGSYYARLITAEGCLSDSDPVEVNFLGIPPLPNFTYNQNELTLFDPEELPDDYGLQWYLNGDVLVGETEQTYCMMESGNYALEVINNETGCSNTYSNQQIFLPNEGCAVSGLNDLIVNSLVMFPNPVSEILTVEIEDLSEGDVSISNGNGSMVFQQEMDLKNGLKLDVRSYLSGFYILTIEGEDVVYREKFFVF